MACFGAFLVIYLFNFYSLRFPWVSSWIPVVLTLMRELRVSVFCHAWLFKLDLRFLSSLLILFCWLVSAFLLTVLSTEMGSKVRAASLLVESKPRFWSTLDLVRIKPWFWVTSVLVEFVPRFWSTLDLVRIKPRFWAASVLVDSQSRFCATLDLSTEMAS